MNMFGCGLLDLIKNFQGVFERIYIKHRTIDEILKNNDNFENYERLEKEM
jgi:hypothetical protein